MDATPDRRTPFPPARSGIALGRDRRIGSTVNGTILVLAALTASYAAERHEPLKLVELVVCVVAVFWLAYVYAHALSESIQRGARIDRVLLRSIADRELGIILAAIAPILALLLGVVGIVTESTSIWIAIASGWRRSSPGLPLLPRRTARCPRHGRDPRRESPARGGDRGPQGHDRPLRRRRRGRFPASLPLGGLDEPDLAGVADVVAQLRREDADDLEPPPLEG